MTHGVNSDAILRIADIGRILGQMQASPTGVRFSDLAKVCEHFSGPPRLSGSSHAVFKTAWPGDPRVNIQNDKGKAKAHQVRQVLAAISKLKGHRQAAAGQAARGPDTPAEGQQGPPPDLVTVRKGHPERWNPAGAAVGVERTRQTMTNNDCDIPAERKSWTDNKMALLGSSGECQRPTKLTPRYKAISDRPHSSPSQ